ncbi:hypothetical protein ACFSJ3_04940 [Corallincola platygyrae]|uniref:Uncharacterized protein n=1 Tax=Corallincola platygyrae TaxID=1193278 RepID=A0ABW4XLZ6_9GAMM
MNKYTRIPLVLATMALGTALAHAEPAVQRYEVIYHQGEVRDLVQVQTEQAFLEMDYQLERDVIQQSSNALSEMSVDAGLQPYLLAESLEQHPEDITAMQSAKTDETNR